MKLFKAILNLFDYNYALNVNTYASSAQASNINPPEQLPSAE